jgi:hypothetical protein
MKTKYRLLLILILTSVIACFFLYSPKYKKLSGLSEFWNKNHYCIPLKIVQFSQGNIPQIEVQIEDKTISCKVDLGSDSGIILPKEVIESLRNKNFIHKEHFFGARGRSYESDVYELPEIRVGKVKIFPMRAEEKNEEFVKDGVLQEGKQEIKEDHLGRIGRCVFKPFNLFLDCDHFAMVICDSLNTLKEQGYPINSFVEVPLLLDRGTIDFEVMTEAGPLRCMLDSGCTWNVLNKDFDSVDQNHMLIDFNNLHGKPPEFNPQNEDLLVYDVKDIWKTNAFQINGEEFGPVEFVKIKSPLGLDAILGMEFIESHLIFIDFRNEKIYFSKLPEERSLFTRTYDFIENGIKKFQGK